MSVKVEKKGKPMKRVTCPECGAIWIEGYAEGKTFECKQCGATLKFEKEQKKI